MTTGFGSFAVGNTYFPLVPATGNSILFDTDASIYWLQKYFKAALQYYDGYRFAQECNAANIPSSIMSSNMVAQSYNFDPFPYLEDTNTKFPLLSIYRTNGSFSELTISHQRSESFVRIVWSLPPLTASQMQRMYPFFTAVAKTISNRSECPRDPNFMDGYNWGAAAGFDSITVLDYEIVDKIRKDKSTDIPFTSIMMTLRLRERDNTAPDQFVNFNGADVDMDLINKPDDTPAQIYQDFVDFKANNE